MLSVLAYRLGNNRGFRSSVPGTRDRDYVFSIISHYAISFVFLLCQYDTSLSYLYQMKQTVIPWFVLWTHSDANSVHHEFQILHFNIVVKRSAPSNSCSEQQTLAWPFLHLPLKTAGWAPWDLSLSLSSPTAVPLPPPGTWHLPSMSNHTEVKSFSVATLLQDKNDERNADFTAF